MSLYCFSNKIVPPGQNLSGHFPRNPCFHGVFTLSALSVPFRNSVFLDSGQISPSKIKGIKIKLLKSYYNSFTSSLSINVCIQVIIYKVLLCEPKSEFKNLAGGKALATVLLVNSMHDAFSGPDRLLPRRQNLDNDVSLNLKIPLRFLSDVNVFFFLWMIISLKREFLLSSHLNNNAYFKRRPIL